MATDTQPEKPASTQALYASIASKLNAMANCEKTGNTEWYHRHKAAIEELVKNYTPSGSGFDCGTTLCFDESTEDKLVFHTSFHHMNEGGMYDGWTEHDVAVTASLAFGFRVKVTGRDRNDIKEYIGEMFATLI